MTDVLIVGAGLAGLACARKLAAGGLSCLLLEASDCVGGRARTDEVEGFLLDRGFQVFLTAYPEAQAILDYQALQLRGFDPGALVRYEGRFHRIADPWRRPAAAMQTLLSPVGTMADKLKLAKLRSLVMKRNGGSPIAEAPTMQFLREFGFSSRMIELFFRPFLGGIFLERELDTASRMFAFVFRMFSLGEAALPAAGMGAIAEQLAGQLPADWVRLRQRVVKVEPGSVAISTGEEIKGSAIVVATDRANAAKLLPEIGPAPWRATTCFYFAAEKAPVPEPILVLNGDGRGPINNLCVPSLVAPSYAPSGVHLVSASVVGGSKVAPEQLLREVKKQLAEWFGDEARSWRHLRTDWIPNALPEPLPGKTATFRPGIYVCGDYRETASINGALESGRKTAEAVLERRQR